MHHGNTVFQSLLGGLKVYLLAFQINMAAVLVVDAKQALHQRGFSGSVLSHQRMHRTGFYGKIYIIERLYTGKLLADALHFQEYIFVVRRCCLFFQIISPPF